MQEQDYYCEAKPSTHTDSILVIAYQYPAHKSDSKNVARLARTIRLGTKVAISLVYREMSPRRMRKYPIMKQVLSIAYPTVQKKDALVDAR